MLVVRNPTHFPVTVPVQGAPTKFRIARITDVVEWSAFNREINRQARLTRGRALLVKHRHPGEEDLTVDQVLIKRWAELPVAEREARWTEEQAEADRGDAFSRDAVRRYVTVEPGELFAEDNAPIVTGEQILEQFGTDEDLLSTLIAQIYLQHLNFRPLSEAVRDQQAAAAPAAPHTEAASAPAPAAVE